MAVRTILSTTVLLSGGWKLSGFDLYRVDIAALFEEADWARAGTIVDVAVAGQEETS